MPPGCDGLTVLPHLEGAFTPEYNPRRAPFSSAHPAPGRGHFVRGLMESVAYMLKRQLDLVEGWAFLSRRFAASAAARAARSGCRSRPM